MKYSLRLACLIAVLSFAVKVFAGPTDKSSGGPSGGTRGDSTPSTSGGSSNNNGSTASGSGSNSNSSTSSGDRTPAMNSSTSSNPGAGPANTYNSSSSSTNSSSSSGGPNGPTRNDLSTYGCGGVCSDSSSGSGSSSNSNGSSSPTYVNPVRQAEINNLSLKVNQINSQIFKVTSEKNVVELKATALKAQNSSVQNQLSSLNATKKAAADTIAKKNAEKAALKNQIAQLPSTIKSIEATNQNLKNQIAKVSADTQKVKAEKIQADKDTAKLRSDSVAAATALTATEKKRQLLASEIAALSAQKDKASAEIAGVSAQKAQAELLLKAKLFEAENRFSKISETNAAAIKNSNSSAQTKTATIKENIGKALKLQEAMIASLCAGSEQECAVYAANKTRALKEMMYPKFVPPAGQAVCPLLDADVNMAFIEKAAFVEFYNHYKAQGIDPSSTIFGKGPLEKLVVQSGDLSRLEWAKKVDQMYLESGPEFLIVPPGRVDLAGYFHSFDLNTTFDPRQRLGLNYSLVVLGPSEVVKEFWGEGYRPEINGMQRPYENGLPPLIAVDVDKAKNGDFLPFGTIQHEANHAGETIIKMVAQVAVKEYYNAGSGLTSAQFTNAKLAIEAVDDIRTGTASFLFCENCGNWAVRDSKGVKLNPQLPTEVLAYINEGEEGLDDLAYHISEHQTANGNPLTKAEARAYVDSWAQDPVFNKLNQALTNFSGTLTDLQIQQLLSLKSKYPGI